MSHSPHANAFILNHPIADNAVFYCTNRKLGGKGGVEEIQKHS